MEKLNVYYLELMIESLTEASKCLNRALRYSIKAWGQDWWMTKSIRRLLNGTNSRINEALFTMQDESDYE